MDIPYLRYPFIQMFKYFYMIFPYVPIKTLHFTYRLALQFYRSRLKRNPRPFWRSSRPWARFFLVRGNVTNVYLISDSKYKRTHDITWSIMVPIFVRHSNLWFNLWYWKKVSFFMALTCHAVPNEWMDCQAEGLASRTRPAWDRQRHKRILHENRPLLLERRLLFDILW